jgi:hypothetical protein
VEPARSNVDQPTEDRRFSVGWSVAGLVVVALVAWGVVAAVTHRDPEDVVEDFLTAIAEKDVDGALELVSRYGYGVPYGEDAAFLTPAAISGDWRVVSVRETKREYSSSAVVEAKIAGPGGTATGLFSVDEVDDDWMVSDPFVEVRFPSSPVSFIRVNDQLVKSTDARYGSQSYKLLPGLYRFYGSVPGVVSSGRTKPVAALPPFGNSYREIVPPTLTAGDRVVERAQQLVDRQIDDCAGFAVAAPPSPCPFATDGEIDTADGKRVTELHSLTWTVEGHPTIELTDDRAGDSAEGFAVRAVDPATVTLAGAGVDTEDQPASFTVTCDLDLSGMRIVVGADGQVELGGQGLVPTETGNVNTCRRNP